MKKGDNKNGRFVLGGQKSALLLRCFFVARDCHDVCIYIYYIYIFQQIYSIEDFSYNNSNDKNGNIYSICHDNYVT